MFSRKKYFIKKRVDLLHLLEKRYLLMLFKRTNISSTFLLFYWSDSEITLTCSRVGEYFHFRLL